MLILTIHDREVVNFESRIETFTKSNEVVNDDDIKIDSTETIKIAISKFNLKPDEDFASGYHFTLSKIDEKPFITTIGLNDNNQMYRVVINSSTREVF